MEERKEEKRLRQHKVSRRKDEIMRAVFFSLVTLDSQIIREVLIEYWWQEYPWRTQLSLT